jgi:hypothetical protein
MATNTAFGTLPNPTSQLFGGNAGGGSAGAPPAQPKPQAQASQGLAPGATPTFAQMQQQGQARPAPALGAPSAGIGQKFDYGASTQNFLGRLDQRLGQMENAPSVYDDPALVKRREAAMANLQAERNASQSKLEEEMASRGLAASSIASGRMGDIAGQFARAQGTLEADLLKESMAQEQQRQQFLTGQLSNLFGTTSERDIQAFGATIDSERAKADIEQKAQDLVLQGRALDITQARDLATAQYQSGQLQQGYADIASRERMQQNQFGFEGSQSALERGLREKMQTQQLTSEEKRQLNQIEANKALQTDQQTFQAGQSQLERELRTTMQNRELTAAEKRQLDEIEANKAEAARTRTFQSEQSKLDRDLRTTLSGNELSQAQSQFEQRFGFEKGQSQNQFLASLAATLAPMDPKKRDEFLRSLGINKPSPVGPGSPTTDPGGF